MVYLCSRAKLVIHENEQRENFEKNRWASEMNLFPHESLNIAWVDNVGQAKIVCFLSDKISHFVSYS